MEKEIHKSPSDSNTLPDPEMITIHHLKQSRSTRIIWLFEELNLDYQLVEYDRDPDTRLAPDSLRDVHPLGKAPIVEDNGLILVESAAIIEYMLDQYAPDQLRPLKSSKEHPLYLQWMHFAEGSAMLPVLLNMFLSGMDVSNAPVFRYAQKEQTLDFDYINDSLSTSAYFAGSEFSAADIMMTTVLLFAHTQGILSEHKHTQAYLQRIQQRPAFQKAASFG